MLLWWSFQPFSASLRVTLSWQTVSWIVPGFMQIFVQEEPTSPPFLHLQVHLTPHLLHSNYTVSLDIQGQLKECYFKKAYYSKCRNGLSWGPSFPLKHYHSENSATHRCFLTHRCANACPNHCVLDLNLVFPGSLVPHTPCNPVKPLSLEHR